MKTAIIVISEAGIALAKTLEQELPESEIFSTGTDTDCHSISNLQEAVPEIFHKFDAIIFIGAMVGRLICGFLCPFGLIQDLLNKIPFPKKIRTFKGDKLLRKLKYVIFLVFVILLPLFLTDIMGQGAPYFCKLICPAGTLEGGLPLVLLNKSMRSALGWLYIWKNVILVITIILSILIYRPFCKYICPLGAFYSVFNPVSLYKYRVDKDKCIKCGKCAKACQMIVDPVENSNSPECIRCGRCRKVCPTDAIQCGIRRKPQS